MSPVSMHVRLLISRLASSQTRGSAIRGLGVLCALGFLATLVVLAAQGSLERWFFWLLVWALFVYAPLRIVLEAAGTLAPALRHRIAAEADRDPSRLHSAAGMELVVDRLLEGAVLMPRIATPLDKAKARDGALAVLLRLEGLPLSTAVTSLLGCVDRWVTDLGPWAQAEAGQNIQARWRDVRALAAMAGMAKVLMSAGGPPLSDGEARDFLDACLDYCDELALEVDVEAWTGPAPHLSISPTYAAALRDAWRAYVETGVPALEARTAFVNLVLRPGEVQTPEASPRPERPSAS